LPVDGSSIWLDGVIDAVAAAIWLLAVDSGEILIAAAMLGAFIVGVAWVLISTPIIGAWIDIDWLNNRRCWNAIALGGHALRINCVISRLQ
jgi:hypothetical protein